MNSEDQTIENGRGDDPIGRLLKLAGEPTAVPEERMERSRERVRAHWRESVEARRGPTTWIWSGIGVGMAASLAAALFLGSWMPWNAAPELARVARISGQLSVLGTGAGQTIIGESGMTMGPGAVLVTGNRDRSALAWHNGHAIRMDHDTRLELVDADRLKLQQGAIYIDSGTQASHAEPITIQTPFGSARDIGTQFIVGSDEQGMVVRVRDGLVEVSSDQIPIKPEAATVGRGYQLRLAAGSGARKEEIQTHGEDWDWAFEIAPDFDLEGKSTAEFLEWLCNEQGWKLEYGNVRVRQHAEATVLHGSVAGLSAEEALDSVLRTMKLSFALVDGTLEINEPTEPDTD